jgi:hypothetical protein
VKDPFGRGDRYSEFCKSSFLFGRLVFMVFTALVSRRRATGSSVCLHLHTGHGVMRRATVGDAAVHFEANEELIIDVRGVFSLICVRSHIFFVKDHRPAHLSSTTLHTLPKSQGSFVG